MVSSPQENESGKKEATKSLELQPLTTAWLTLTSPWTVAVSTALLAMLLVASAVVPQGLGGSELLEYFSFSEGRVIEGLGIQNVWTGWAVMILAIVGTLSVVGLLLRRLPNFGDREEHDNPRAVLVSVEEITVSQEPSDIVEHLRALGIKGKASEADSDGRIDIHSSSMLPQGRWMVAIGVVLCAVSLVLDSQGALRYEADHIPSRPEVEGATRVLEDGRWVDQKAAFDLRCNAADPADESLRQRTCVFRSGDQNYKFPLHAGEAVRAGDHRIQFEREKPIPTREITDRAGNRTGRIPIRLLLEGDKPSLVSGESGKWLRLGDGRELKLIAGADGPIVVVREKDKKPVLLVPRASIPSMGAERYAGMSAVPDWTVTTSVNTEPGRLLRYGSWLVMSFGLLLMLLFRQLDVVLIPIESGKTAVTIRSSNRPNAPSELVGRLEERVRT